MDKEEFIGIKMRKGLILSKKGGQLTPVPSWKMEEEEAGPSNSHTIDRTNKTSARKLGACLWEVQNQSLLCNINIMGKSKVITSEPNSPTLQPKSTSRCMKNIGTAYNQLDLCRRINVDFDHQSSAVIDSSVETSSVDPMVTQRSSSHLYERRGSRYNIKTSAELVRVLNRIWRLEEELASNVSLVKTLKADLRYAHSHIQELIEKQQTYVTRVLQNKLTRTDKEHDKLMITIQSLNHEIEDEKRLRQGSESLHHRLDKELAEVKFLYKNTLKELESERNARSFLEGLCDEFSKGLLEYEEEYKKNTSDDHSLHRLSKLWLDERLKMKSVEARGNESERNGMLQNIHSEILSYLQTKRCSSSKNDGKEGNIRRQSVESFHFNGTVSAPKEDDDDSMISNFHCLEFKADSKINKLGLEGQKGKLKAALVNETGKMEGHAKCSMIQDVTHLSNGNTSHLLDSSTGNSSHSGIENSVKDNSLKKKLIEARLEGQNARLRALKGSSVVE